MAEDNWEHWSRNMSCQFCMWFVRKVKDQKGVVVASSLGRCRRHAPTMAGWPVMFDSDWCGDHKLDETKV